MNKGSGYMSKIKKYISNPWEIVSFFVNRGMLNWMDDKSYLKLNYRAKIGKRLNLDNPQTFNEKLQWLKLNDRRDEYTTMVDKYLVKDYVAGIIGEEYIIPTIGVYDHFDDIDFDQLPNQFVIKCTHDSGGLVICKDKSELDISSAKKKIEKCLKNNYFYRGREWPYKNVKPRIIVEEYLEDGDRIVPEDYKIYCFDGKPKYIVVFHNRYLDESLLSESVYDTDWNKQDISLDYHFAVSNEVEERPRCLDKMLDFATKLSANIPQSRIDFYIVNDKIKFGEITLYTASGTHPMIPESLDEELGKLIPIDDIKKAL